MGIQKVTIAQLKHAIIKLITLIRRHALAIINVFSMGLNVKFIKILHALLLFVDINPIIRIMIKMLNFVILYLTQVGLLAHFMFNRLHVLLLSKVVQSIM